MVRASRVLRTLTPGKEPESLEVLACAAWRGVVGKKIARHAAAERLVRTRLIIGVEDAIWRQQLFTMRKMILDRIQQFAGPGLVEELEFRIAPPRMEPQRASRSTSAQASLFDEATAIQDPGLRRLYVASRKRVSA